MLSDAENFGYHRSLVVLVTLAFHKRLSANVTVVVVLINFTYFMHLTQIW